MKKQHTQKMTVRVTAQTAYNLERLMLMSGQKTPGRADIPAAVKALNEQAAEVDE